MRIFLWLVGLLACVMAAGAEKPVLVLDAGGHTATVRDVLFTPDERELITVSEDKTIRVWDTLSGEPLRVIRPPVGTGDEGRLFAAALSPDGQWLAVGGYRALTPSRDHRIYLISLPKNRIERVLKGHTNVIHALAFSQDGKCLASGSSDRTARVWNVADGRCEATLEGHSKQVFGVAFSPDARHLATASYDKTGRIWDIAAIGKTSSLSAANPEAPNQKWEFVELGGHDEIVRCVVWSGDGRTVATGSDDESVRLWNADGSLRKEFTKLGNHVTTLAFSADSRELLVTRGGPYVGSPLDDCSLITLATGQERLRFTRHTNTVLAATLAPKRGWAATSGGNDKETFLWNTSDGAVLQLLASLGRAVCSAAWSSDGSSVAWGHSNDPGSFLEATTPLERSFNLVELEFGPSLNPQVPDSKWRRAQTSRGALSLEQTGRVTANVMRGNRAVTELKQTQDDDNIRCFTLVHGDRVAIGANYGMYVFDANTGEQLRKFQGHTGEVWAVSPSPDNRYLLSASGDQTLRVWTLDRDEPLLSLFFTKDDWIAWTPEGYYAASPGGEKLMGWHVNNGPDQLASFYPASQFRSTLYRPDVIKLLLKTGSVARALEIADTARGRMTQKTEVAQVLPPQVRITSPVADHKAPQNTVAIRATATSVGKHPVTVLRLLLDGRPYQGQRGVQTIASPKLGEVDGEWTIVLEPGKHKLKVLADSAVSQGISEEVEVVYVGGGELADQVRLPKLYVVAVGISDYPGDLKLSYAAKDAEALTVALKSHSKSLFREIEAQTITNAQATRAAVLKGLGWLRSNMTQNDYGIFFFAGHREFDNDGSVYFLPVDVDPLDLLTTAIGDDQFKKALAGIPGKMMTMLDSCNSGAVAGSQTGKRRAAGSSLTDDLVRDLVTDENGVVAMCSSTGREFSLENNEFRQGNFTLALVEGLSGKADFNKDGVVYLNELDTYVTDRVKELTKGQQHPVTGKPGSIRSFPLAKP